MLDQFLGREQERQAIAAGDTEAVILIRAWRRGRIVAVIGMFCALLMVAISLLQISGLVGRPMPPLLWGVFGAAFVVVMAINFVVLRKARER